MHLALIDWIIIVGFLLLTLYIGWRFKTKKGGTISDFFLGGRNLPWYVAGLSMVATTFAADTPLAVSEMVAQNGVSKNWLWWSFLSGGMLTVFFFARLWRRANIVTELEFIDIRYSGKPAKLLRGFKAIYLGVFMNGMIIGWVNLAFAALLETFFGIDSSTVLWYVFAAMIFAAAYSSLSGLLGVAITDTVQFFIAMVGTIILAWLVLSAPEVGGIDNLKSELPKSYFHLFPRVGDAGGLQVLSLSIGAFLTYVTVQWWASWYPGSEPGGGGYIAQRMMSAKTEQDAQKATLFFQIAHYCVRPWPWILVGLAAILLYDPHYSLSPEVAQQIETYKEAGMTEGEVMAQFGSDQQQEIEKQVKYSFQPQLGYVFAMRDYLPDGLRGLLLVAFLAAYLSTISTQLNMGASFLVNDLYMPFIAKDSSKNQVLSGRIATLLLMLVGILVTSVIDTIAGVWEFIIEAGAGLGAVLILRWYWWRINAWSEIAAMVAPFIGYFIGQILGEQLGAEFVENKGPYLFTVLFTTIAWLVTTYVTSAEPDEKIKSFYNRVKPEGAWGRFADPLVRTKNKQSLRWRLWCWICGILLTYCTLFAMGSFLLHGNEWQLYAVLAAGGAIGLSFGLNRLKKWDQLT